MIVYKITNKINQKVYIGQTKTSLKTRWLKHCNSGNCRRLFSAIKKYGKEAFLIEEIGWASTQEQLNKFEVIAINKYKSLYPSGYNLKCGGNGFKHSEETKKLIGLSHLGSKRNFEACEKMSKAAKGRIISDAQKHAISKTLLNKLACKKIKCVENGIIYRSAKLAAKELYIRPSGISLVLSGKQKSTGGYTFVYQQQEVV